MPARKPTNLKVLQGTLRRDRLNPNEPEAGVGRPCCPPWLDAVARGYWDALADHLEEMSVLTQADGHALALLCAALSEYQAAIAVLQIDGPTYKCVTKAGDMMVRQRPEVAIAQDAWRRAKMMLEQFGLTPAARSRVEARPAPNQRMSIFAKFAQGRPTLNSTS
jgi:P27 family predicted phage terminase small subunit